VLGVGLCRLFRICTLLLVGSLVFAEDEQAAKDSLVVQALLRLENVDLDALPQAKDALLRYLRAHPDNEDFLTLVGKFQLAEMSDLLMAQAAEHSDATEGVEAARLLLKFKPLDELQQILRTPQTEGSPLDRAALFAALGRTDQPAVQQLAVEYARQPSTDAPLRRAAIAVAGRSESGQRSLLKSLENGDFDEELHVALVNVLLSSKSAEIRNAASQRLKLPKTAGSEPLPPLSQLVEMRGDVITGSNVFRQQGTCIKCHQIGLEGKPVGPNLSEIGDKLAREAMYLSILDPSGAISFNFETYNVLLADGRDASGILISNTDESITIKTAEAIEQKIPRDQIEEIVQQKVSLMPVGLAQNMTTQQFVDLVEYLLSLKKTGSRQ
jgi:putative heme-binding domain-containing protein